ncbi:hypothetical protein [Aurantimonas sp. VKM B-3413]|uniref:hypothetical protein n=1 Tax=Aurantimonas sp. VKM B-3413 TaxID=2779401 RepID=UPI001E442B6B|nr:hypothetical protein [Aurantimonas sp. VKM B-3413]
MKIAIKGASSILTGGIPVRPAFRQDCRPGGRLSLIAKTRQSLRLVEAAPGRIPSEFLGLLIGFQGMIGLVKIEMAVAKFFKDPADAAVTRDASVESLDRHGAHSAPAKSHADLAQQRCLICLFEPSPSPLG